MVWTRTTNESERIANCQMPKAIIFNFIKRDFVNVERSDTLLVSRTLAVVRERHLQLSLLCLYDFKTNVTSSMYISTRLRMTPPSKRLDMQPKGLSSETTQGSFTRRETPWERQQMLSLCRLCRVRTDLQRALSRGVCQITSQGVDQAEVRVVVPIENFRRWHRFCCSRAPSRIFLTLGSCGAR